ncbi:hypothetical protein [Streptomyces olivaceiscleroticus]|uniref:PE domain-containing protein n=1 Tax=Streptomyces olivaceiscleroticus TaxID=68245 RepID=A0ABP3LIA1_9ACTN
MPDLTFDELQAGVAALAKSIAQDTERLAEEARYIDEEAQDTARVADQIGAMRVDSDTISETQELARIMGYLSQSITDYAAAGNTTAKQAQAVHATNASEHGGIKEAVNRSPVGREIYDLDAEWFRQE